MLPYLLPKILEHKQLKSVVHESILHFDLRADNSDDRRDNGDGDGGVGYKVAMFIHRFIRLFVYLLIGWLMVDRGQPFSMMTTIL